MQATRPGGTRGHYDLVMRVLVIADEPWIRNEVHAALSEPDHIMVDLDRPGEAAAAVAAGDFDAAVVDLQVGSMGGMAITRSIRDASGNGESRGLPVVMLLDRAADSFLAKRAGAAAWLTKPFTAHELRSALLTAGAAPDTVVP